MQSHPMPFFLKVARADSDRLVREAAVLRHVEHPDVVEVGSFDGEALQLERIEGRTLADSVAVAPTDSLAIFATLAAVVAYLHSRGVAHTRINSSHVMLRTSGRPVLCGFGDATPMPQDDDSLAYADVAAIGKLMIAAGPDPLARLRDRSRNINVVEDEASIRLATLGRRAKNGEFTAVQLCTALRALPKPRETACAPRRRWRHFLSAASVIVLVVSGAAIGTQYFGSSNVPASAAAKPTIPPAYSGRLTYGEDTFSLATSDDQAVLARWNCGTALPVLLRHKDGTVWVFSEWPSAGAQSTGREVPGVSGATNITISVLGPCDTVSITTAGGASRSLDLRTV